MNLWENLRMALSSIFANKLRSLLTMIGIIIGICAVITITTLGTTLRSTITTTLNSLGSNVMGVYPETRADNYYDSVQVEMTDEDYIKYSMIEELIEKYPEIRVAEENPVGGVTFKNTIDKELKGNLVGAYNGTLDYDG